MHFYPLYTLNRGPIAEITVYGYSVIAEPERLILGRHENMEDPIILRSLGKPWQFLNLDIDNHSDFMTLGFASHSGQSIHQQKLAEFQKHYEISADLLQCPAVWPMDIKAKMAAKSLNDEPKTIFHPCSGKHLAHLAKCKIDAIDTKTYLQPTHPLQKKLLSLIQKSSEVEVMHLTDSCGLPTFGMPLKGALRMSQKLVKDDSDAARRLFELWKQFPRLMGGINRLDSDISEDLCGFFVAKEAADGLFLVQSLVPDQPITIITKLAGGYHPASTTLALWAALEQNKSPHKILQMLKEYIALKVREILPEDQTFHSCPVA